jgi:hypothetical protein
VRVRLSDFNIFEAIWVHLRYGSAGQRACLSNERLIMQALCLAGKTTRLHSLFVRQLPEFMFVHQRDRR